ncbi:MAG: mechanosensitive ion channel family protein [Thermaurantimonas sp.]
MLFSEKFLSLEDIDFFTDRISKFLHLSPSAEDFIILVVDLLLLLLITSVSFFISKKILLSYLHKVVSKTETQIDDILLEKKVFNGLANLIPAIIAYYSLPILFRNYVFMTQIVESAIKIYVVLLIVSTVHRFLKSLEIIALGFDKYKDKPIKSYLQVANIINYIMGAVLLISIISGSDLNSIFLKLGALTAVLLLIFKDTILGLVASIQISANELLRVGDWVSLDKYGADGDVIEINLTTVKIRNWDKTITTIPTYAFISDSFKNWRGMQSAGVRRIKRSLFINMHSVKICTPEMIERYKKFQLISSYIDERLKQIEEYNQKHHIDTSNPINGRQMTNLGVFRQYALEYIKSKSSISTTEPVLVRHLQPTENGLPFEIYCFTTHTALLEYEALQADLFDHFIAVVPFFDLELFQNPAGSDFRALAAGREIG